MKYTSLKKHICNLILSNFFWIVTAPRTFSLLTLHGILYKCLFCANTDKHGWNRKSSFCKNKWMVWKFDIKIRYMYFRWSINFTQCIFYLRCRILFISSYKSELTNWSFLYVNQGHKLKSYHHVRSATLRVGFALFITNIYNKIQFN